MTVNILKPLLVLTSQKCVSFYAVSFCATIPWYVTSRKTEDCLYINYNITFTFHGHYSILIAYKSIESSQQAIKNRLILLIKIILELFLISLIRLFENFERMQLPASNVAEN